MKLNKINVHGLRLNLLQVSAGGEHHRKRRDVGYETERLTGNVAPLPYRAYDMN